MSCRLVRRHIGVMVDGELDPATQIEFERHLAECVGCQERLAFEQGMRGQVREALGETRAPDTLANRVRGALDAADRQAERAERGVIRMWPMRARHAVPLAAAVVAMALLFGGPLSAGDGGQGAGAQQAAVGGGSMLDDVVRLHSHSLPADVPGEQPRQVSRYFQSKVEFPVRAAKFGRRDVRLTGARLANVRDRRAAALYYNVHGRRMTLVMFEPPSQPFPGRQGVLRARFGGRELAYRRVREHVVPVRHHGGLAYALTGDLSRKQLLELAASLRVKP